MCPAVSMRYPGCSAYWYVLSMLIYLLYDRCMIVVWFGVVDDRIGAVWSDTTVWHCQLTGNRRDNISTIIPVCGDRLTRWLPKTEISVFQRPTLACKRRRFPSLWRNVCFLHPHVTNYICTHCTMCYTVRKKKCSPLFWYKAIIVWFSQFIMTVVQN